MKFHYAPSISQKLLMLVTVCVLPMGTLSAYLINFDYQQTRDSYALLAQAASDISVAYLDTTFSKVENSLTMLTKSTSFRRNHLLSLEHEIRNASNLDGGLCIVLRDSNGVEVINSSISIGTPLSSKPTFVPHAASFGEFSIWKSTKSANPKITGPVIVVETKLPNVGKSWGTLSAEIPMERIHDALRAQSGFQNQVQIIFDQKGQIVSTAVDAEKSETIQPLLDFLASSPVHLGKDFRLRTHDDMTWLLASSHSNDTDWTIATGIPETALQTQALSKLWTFSSSVALMCIAGMLGALLIARRIRRAVRALVAPALALGSGRDFSIPRLHMREAQEVLSALLTASEMLKHAQYEASHDTLTGLANRALMTDYLKRQLDLCERKSSSLTIVYIDLDNFKCVNDNHGHHIGDLLLLAASKRLISRVRKSDMIARMGGDEFVIILVAKEAEARQIVAKLAAKMDEHYCIEGLQLYAPASMGTAIYPQSGTTIEELINSADAAMYKAKVARHVVDRQCNSNDNQLSFYQSG